MPPWASSPPLSGRGCNSEILADSFPLLEQVVKILVGAESVRRFLIERGVEPSRLEAKGYGPDQPIDTNSTAAGRQKNRRTEFISISE
jgi:hypothetical protein